MVFFDVDIFSIFYDIRIEVPKEIIETLIGKLLGDAYARFNASIDAAQIQFYQGGLLGVKYNKWLYTLLLPVLSTYFLNKGLPRIFIKKDKRTGKSYMSSVFSTMYLKEINRICHQFYPYASGNHIGKKVVPFTIFNNITPRILATWIIDDGAWDPDGIYICTDSFDLSEVLSLGAGLERLYQIEWKIRKTGRLRAKKYRIFIPKSSMAKIEAVTAQHMMPEYLYKVRIQSPPKHFYDTPW